MTCTILDAVLKGILSMAKSMNVLPLQRFMLAGHHSCHAESLHVGAYFTVAGLLVSARGTGNRLKSALLVPAGSNPIYADIRCDGLGLAP